MTDISSFTDDQLALWAILQEAHADDETNRDGRVDALLEQQEQQQENLETLINCLATPVPLPPHGSEDLALEHSSCAFTFC